MESKVFYTIISQSGIVGIKKQDGFEVKMEKTVFYAYVGERGRVFVIDPKNGISLFEYSGWHDFDDDELVPDIIKVERAMTKLEESDALKEWEALKDKKSYTYTIKMYDALLVAQKYREKQKELAKKGR